MTMLAEVDLVISPNAVYIGLGTVVGIVVGAVVATTKVVGLLAAIRAEMTSMRNAIKELKEALNGSYSKSDATEAFERLSLANPSLRVPRPDSPGKFFARPAAGHEHILDT